MGEDEPPEYGTGRGTAGEVFAAFLALGVSAFGGPVAHLGYFRARFVGRWLSEAGFGDLVALCSVLPGPTSSQVGAAIGFRRAGWAGAAAAWTGFTLPSAVLMIAVALLARGIDGRVLFHVEHGLALAAVAIVAQAVVGMARSLTPDWPRKGLALAAAAIVAAGGAFGQVAAIAVGAAAGAFLPRVAVPAAVRTPRMRPVTATLVPVAILVTLLVAAFCTAQVTGSRSAALAAACLRAGALVFGGGHVVLPLLQASVVPHLVGRDAFLAGYGAAQAVPGPLFTFAAFLGATVGGVGGGLIALVALFAPGMLLLAAALPWAGAVTSGRTRAAVAGVNAAVVGVLAAALVSPVGTAAILGPGDALLAAAALAALLARAPPLAVVAALVAVQVV
ncbi:MAG: chromate efflux transporter [Sphingomonadaceae bacterium]|nr:chromate efflux transporter [Sphingomonadaceae bacterium]